MDKLLKKILKVIGIVALLAVVATVIILVMNAPAVDKAAFAKDPDKAVQEAFDRTFECINNSTFTPFEVAENTLANGSMTITNGNDVNCIVSHDLQNKKYLTSYKKGSDAWSWSLHGSDLYIGEGEDFAYRVPLTNLKETIQNSQINQAKDKYDIPFEARVGRFYPGFSKAYSEGLNDVISIPQTLFNQLFTVLDNTDVVAEEEILRQNNRQIEVYSVEYSLSNETTVNFLNTIVDWCEKEDQGYDDYISNIFRMMITDATGIAVSPQKYKECADTILNNISILALRSKADSYFKVSVDAKTGYVVYAEWFLTDIIYNNRTNTNLCIEFPLDYTGQSEFKIRYEQKGDSELSNCKFVVTMKQGETREAVEKSVSVDYESYDMIWKEDETFFYSKTDNSFAITTLMNEQTKVVSGVISIMGNETRLLLDKLILGDAEYQLSLSATILDTPVEYTPPVGAINALEADLNTAKAFIEKANALPDDVFGSHKFNLAI